MPRIPVGLGPHSPLKKFVLHAKIDVSRSPGYPRMVSALGPPKTLLADRMLGKLARLLRMTGQDVEYVREGLSDQIVTLTRDTGRLLLTRDRRMIQLLATDEVYFVQNNYPFHQARAVIRDLGLAVASDFTRCVDDNGLLSSIRREGLESEVPARVLGSTDRFFRCDRCLRVFWEGSHVRAMREMISALTGAPLFPDEPDLHSSDDRLRTRGGAGHAATHPLEMSGSSLGSSSQGSLQGSSQGTSAISAISVDRLEPVLDLHQALDVLLLRHRLALMQQNISLARRTLARFSLGLRRHIEDEQDLVLPVYRESPPAGGFERGAAPELFDREHEKILDHLQRMLRSLDDIEGVADQDAQAVLCLRLLDREKVFTDLLEHHDQRERTYLYPALETLLSDEEKLDLVQRMLGSGTTAFDVGS